MEKSIKERVAELEAQLTPRGAFEAIRWDSQTAEGKRFCEIYFQIRELEGDPIKM